MDRNSLKFISYFDGNIMSSTEYNNGNIHALSKELQDNKIEHIIVDDFMYGISIILKQDMPSLIIYNEEEQQWEYIARYFDEADNVKILQIYVVKDINQNIDILDFIKVVIKTQKEN